MRGMRILVVEDELKMAGLLRRGLVEEGHAVDIARTGDDALWMAQAAEYDAVVLDLMLPGVDGIEVCRRLREDGVWAPVLMLTARDAVEDRVAGLDAGADDYLPKPFSFAELLARLRALDAARRCPAGRPCSRWATCASTRRSRQVWRGETEVSPLGQGVRDPRDVHAAPGPGAVARTSCSSTRGTTPTRIARTSSTSTFATCATRSTGRSDATRSRPCAASATGCDGTARREAAPGPAAADAGVRRSRWRSCSAGVGAFLYVRLGGLARRAARTRRLEARADALAALVADAAAQTSTPAALASSDDDGFVAAADRRTAPSSRHQPRSATARSSQRQSAAGQLAVALRGAAFAGTAAAMPGCSLAPAVHDGEPSCSSSVHRSRIATTRSTGLLAQLLVVGPVALVLSSLAGYLLAAAALRPVEAMRRQRGDDLERPGRSSGCRFRRPATRSVGSARR